MLTSNLFKAIRYPRRTMVELYGLGMNAIFGGNRGEFVLDRDWDNLIILDACRYDLFVECNTIEGDLQQFHSRGSHTGEFMEQNFSGGTFPDTIYVSANPNPGKVDAEFAVVKALWNEAWDEELRTVPPERVVDATLEMSEAYPKKRLIIHLLQPHYPWIGPKGQEFHDRHGYTDQSDSINIWTRLRDGEFEHEEVWEVYRENLKVTLLHVERLVDGLFGKTVITSDHGNAFGEWSVYGHPGNAYIESLTRVPWLICPYEERKEITAEDTIRKISNEKDPTEKKLRNLGYLE